MTILIAGATGNVGRPLVEQLLAAGHPVRALTRNPAKANLPEGAEVIAGNLSDTSSLVEAFKGVTAAHLISFNGEDFSPLENGPEIVKLAKESGVRKVTVLKGDVTKSPLEEAVEAGGLEWTFLSPVEFMSNALEWTESIKNEGVVREAFAQAKSAMVHDADIAAVAAVALTSDGHAGQEYWITGPQALTPPEKVRAISEALGREVKYVELSQDEIVAEWRQTGYSDEDVEFFLTMRTNPPEAGYTVQDTVERVTGKPPRTFVQWVKENAAAFTA
ncbi:MULTISPECIES: NmrA family NAD(P)-binding protein [Streptomyces]|uniref:Nucleotide-diphosphate-sugar epimerase n=1 Tax=Streptomyces rubiginosohelvolus TaxID=67362 RepID=A0ABQ3CC38_9ACTN|nr:MULTISPECIES: NmrA family NAD(P)-binding protein [Streptomyces]WAS29260.1 putative hydroxylase [Streptomyces sp.]WST51480.1 NmrA family NAD(P)-binding protein [Streptomyces rubiginosohelvolus]GGS18645.1 nucleotide-diphosphate-sugar epimerase [Streptomyces rubiginosohelvolus]GGZ83371.1 nucleotide-diphosphate-sugar epimerase [Streptomyces pluricolorescens]